MTPLSNQDILAELDRLVVGHQEAKKTLITMVSRSKLRWYQQRIKQMDNEFLVAPMKVLLVGASGSGKTHLIESLQSIDPFPLIRLDATNLNPSGASGGIKAEDLKKMINAQAMQMCIDFPYTYDTPQDAINRTVIFIDEIDKLGRSFESSGNWNKHVQSNFLTILDNKEDFAGVSFVLAGAFGDITEKVAKPKDLGFTHQKYEPKQDLIDVRILRSGLIPEIVGRITAICELDVFEKKDFLYILKEKILPKKRLDMAAYGIFDIDVKDEELEKIAADAANSGQGVRYLHRIIDKIFLAKEFEVDVDRMMYLEFMGGLE